MRKGMLYAVSFMILSCTVAAAATPGGAFQPARDHAAALDAERSDCQVGSLEFEGYQGYYSDFWTSGQTYFQLIRPAAEGCACGAGVTVSNVDMFILANMSANFYVQAELWSAVDDGSGCLEPGGPLAVGTGVNFTGFPAEDIYHLSAPLGSPCLAPNDAYFVAFTYLDISSGSFLGVPVDSTPAACEQYVKTDGVAGHVDPVAEYGWLGNFYVFADLDCCSDPVANDRETWGAVKRMYR